MNELSVREKRAAERWAMLMLDDPEHHRAEFERWAEFRIERRTYYDRLIDNLQSAGRAAALGPGPAPHHASPVPDKPALRIAVLAALITGLVGPALYLSGPWQRSAGPALPSPADLATRVGEVRTTSLSDGSMVILDTATIVRPAFTARVRQVELVRGRARFSVFHDAAHPFIVLAGGKEIIAKGTVFDVTVGSGLVVHLIQGKIEIRDQQQSQKMAVPIMLHAGQQMTRATTIQSPPQISTAPASDAQWVSGRKSFDDAMVRDVVDEANTYSTRKIILRPTSLGNARIFGEVDVRNTQAVANAVGAYLGVPVDQADSEILIGPKK